MSQEVQEFDFRYSQKGKDVLDNIFGEFAPDRERISLIAPKREHEVVMQVEYESKEQFGRVLGQLCEWLSKEDRFERLENLMLY